jgi:hypothetical protein
MRGGPDSGFEELGQSRAVGLAFVARFVGEKNGKHPRKHNERARVVGHALTRRAK